MQAQTLGPGLGFPGLATLALRPLLHQVLGVVGGCTQGVGGGGGGRGGTRRQGACCFEQARRRAAGAGIGFQPSCIFGWMGWGPSWAGTAAHRGAPPSPAHTLTEPLPRQATIHCPPHTLQAEGSQASGLWLVNHFGPLETVAELL